MKGTKTFQDKETLSLRIPQTDIHVHVKSSANYSHCLQALYVENLFPAAMEAVELYLNKLHMKKHNINFCLKKRLSFE